MNRSDLLGMLAASDLGRVNRFGGGVILVCVALAIASLLFALNARDAARDAALVHTGERDQMTSVRVVIEDSLAAAMDRYTAQGAALQSLNEEVKALNAKARSERRKADALVGTLISQVAAVASDSAAVVALVDSIVVAKDEVIHVLETQLAGMTTENMVLWKRDTLSAAAIAGFVASVEALHLELDAANRRGDAWEQAASPGFALKWGSRSSLIVAGIGLAILAR